MPKLSRPAVSFKITKEEAEQSVRVSLTGRKWANAGIEKTTLILRPFYVIDFDLFDTEEKGGKEIVSEHSTEKISFDPNAREISRENLDAFANESALSNEIPNDIEFRAVRPALSSDQAKNIASLIFSKEKGLPVEKIIVSGIRLFYYPYWLIEISPGNGRMEVEIDAVSGAFLRGGIPARAQPASELAMETLSELKDPSNWLVYFKDLFLLIFRGVMGLPGGRTVKWFWSALFHNRYFQYLLMLILLVLLVFLVFRFL